MPLPRVPCAPVCPMPYSNNPLPWRNRSCRRTCWPEAGGIVHGTADIRSRCRPPLPGMLRRRRILFSDKASARVAGPNMSWINGRLKDEPGGRPPKHICSLPYRGGDNRWKRCFRAVCFGLWCPGCFARPAGPAYIFQGLRHSRR